MNARQITTWISCVPLVLAEAPAFAQLPPEPEAVSLLGRPLFAPILEDSLRKDREQKLAEARAQFDKDSTDVEAIIWLGRRTAYLGRYREAIDIFTRGIEKHPKDVRLYRHRGHRYLTTRQLDLAVADLEKAAGLIKGTQDAVEPDGLPNDRNIPTSTLHGNVWYHLGLARYLQGGYEAALVAYHECLQVSKNPDMLVATTYWLWLTLRRMHQVEEAEKVLTPIHADLDVIENGSYHRLLLLYKGEADADSLLEASGDALQNATIAYGVGTWHLVNDRPERAGEIYNRIVEAPEAGILSKAPEWAAFGFLAAEAELARAASQKP